MRYNRPSASQQPNPSNQRRYKTLLKSRTLITKRGNKSYNKHKPNEEINSRMWPLKRPNSIQLCNQPNNHNRATQHWHAQPNTGMRNQTLACTTKHWHAQPNTGMRNQTLACATKHCHAHLWNHATQNIASKRPNHFQGMQFICSFVGDEWTKNQENVMAYNEMIQKVHSGIELEFNFADALGPSNLSWNLIASQRFSILITCSMTVSWRFRWLSTAAAASWAAVAIGHQLKTLYHRHTRNKLLQRLRNTCLAYQSH